MNPLDARRERVLRVVTAGRRVADPADPLGREVRARLLAEGILSAEGIELALAGHLEIDPAPAEIDALLASAGAAPRCHVVLSANVCTAALRAIAVAVATAPAVFVRPSRRDPVLADVLARELAADAPFAAHGGSIERVETARPEAEDELHVYGSDEAVRAIAAAAPEGTIVRGHGAGLGVAVIGAGASIEAAAEALARDVIPFDQRGCLSPRAALVEGGEGRAEAFAEALHRALGRLGAEVPRGPLDAQARGEIAMYRAAVEALGVWGEGPHHGVGLDPAPRALPMPPAARVVHVAAAEAGTAAALLAPWAEYVTIVGSEGGGALTAAIERMAPRARRARLGAMQRPPLDGPVDLRRR
jgi:hypothetical protein